MNRATMRRSFWLVLLFAGNTYAQSAAQPAAPSAGPVFPNPGKTSMSKENQHALGMQAAREVYQQMPVLPDTSPETQYIRQLGAKLVSTIPPEYSWPFEFHVVPQKEINAFALPGGQMFINVGTITAAKNESELAGVMGHEMAHVYMQHSAKQAGKAQTTNMVAGVAAAVLGGTVGSKMGGLVGQLGTMGIQMGAEGLMLKHSRHDESQADAVGAMILYKAGYSPQGMADFFHTMGSQGGKAPPQFMSSHPNPENREHAIQQQIASWPKTDFVGASPQFDALRQHASQLQVFTAAEIQQGAKSGQWAALNQRNGASFHASGDRGGASSFPTRAELESANSPTAAPLQSVLPSQKMVRAELGPMKIDRPENWTLTLPEQHGQFVTIAPQSGITNSGVGYGVLINGAAGPEGQRISIDDLTNALIQQIQQSNQLEQLGKPEPIMVGGVQGRSTRLQSPSPFPDANGQVQKEGDWLVTVPRGEGVIFMIFVAPQSDFARFQPTFEAMLKSAQFK